MARLRVYQCATRGSETQMLMRSGDAGLRRSGAKIIFNLRDMAAQNLRKLAKLIPAQTPLMAT